MLGKKLSDTPRAKMALSARGGGVSVVVKDVETGVIQSFPTKTAAALHLGMSLRTLSRWLNDSTNPKTFKRSAKRAHVLVSFGDVS
jgi:hypothetical protein